eukprot:2521292-Alexandrium_andersonii.AAC.1
MWRRDLAPGHRRTSGTASKAVAAFAKTVRKVVNRSRCRECAALFERDASRGARLACMACCTDVACIPIVPEWNDERVHRACEA